MAVWRFYLIKGYDHFDLTFPIKSLLARAFPCLLMLLQFDRSSTEEHFLLHSMFSCFAAGLYLKVKRVFSGACVYSGIGNNTSKCCPGKNLQNRNETVKANVEVQSCLAQCKIFHCTC